MNRLRSLLFSCFVFFALTAEEGDCGGPEHFINDSGFDLWCGAELCTWDLEKGDVQRAATWHTEDPAVELIGDNVVLSQLSGKGASSANCIRFEMLADISEDARLVLELDFYDDGVVDYQLEIGHVRWAPLVYKIPTPSLWSGVRFRLQKTGGGRVRLAQIEAIGATGCTDAAISLPMRPLGALCWDGSDCEDGFCVPTMQDNDKVCAACASDEDCDDGRSCGVGEVDNPFLEVSRDCVVEASRPLGLLCNSGAECSSGVCCQNVCSSCCSLGECREGMGCIRSATGAASLDHMPFICRAPGGNASGSECVNNADCASDSCSQGTTLSICELDGRSCNDDAQCPGNGNPEVATCVKSGYYDAVCE